MGERGHLPASRADVHGGEWYSFPVPNDTFDIVIATNVLEHVRKVWVWIKELSRACKPGGHVITINPVSWPYHEIPIDCWRAYPEGMKALYEDGGLEVILSKCEAICGCSPPQQRPRTFPERRQQD